MEDYPSETIRTAIGVCVGLMSGLVIFYYLIRLCRAIAMYPKDDADEALPAYQPPSTLPAIESFYTEEDDNSTSGRRPSISETESSFSDVPESHLEQVPISTPAQPSPAYLSLSRSSGYYYNGEMTQVGDPSLLPPGTFIIPLPAPTRPATSPRRSTGLVTLARRLSGRASPVPATIINIPAETGPNEPPPPSYSDVVGESRFQPSFDQAAGSERITHAMEIV